MSEPHDVEGRLRAALRARAESVEPIGRFDAVERGVRAVRTRRRAVAVVAALALVVAATTGVVVLATDDSDPTQVVTEPTTSTEAPTTTGAPPATTTVPATVAAGWPGDDVAGYETPEDAALAFATDVLGYADPSVVGAGLASGQVEVQPRPTSSIRTSVTTARGASGHVVTGATTDASGRIDAMEFLEPGTLRITGEASAFEATLYIQLLAIDGEVIGETFTMAGSTELLPYEATVEHDPATPPHFVLIGDGDASGEGRFTWAAVAMAPASPDRPSIEADALVGVPFGTDPDEAIARVATVSGGSVTSDETQRAEDVGATGFPCHGPDGPSVRELRRAAIGAGDVELTLYIADGVFMGFVVAGTDAAYRTQEGVGLGSSEDELVAAYGDRLTIQPGIGELDRWASLEITGSPLPITFRYEVGQPVHEVVVGGRCAD